MRWLIQRGIVPVVKSANPVRMKENLDIFDFALSEEDMKPLKKQISITYKELKIWHQFCYEQFRTQQTLEKIPMSEVFGGTKVKKERSIITA